MQPLLWIYAASGAAGLLYEVLWFRRLSLLFGGSAPASACVLAAYLGATALGAEAARRWKARPLSALAGLQAFIGLHALASRWLFAAVGRVFLPLLPAAPGAGLALGELAAAFAAIGLPCAAMGASLPLLSSLFPDNSAESGLLLGLGTAAGAAGALAGGWLFLPFLGLERSTLAAAALSLGAAAGTLLIKDRWAPQPRPPAHAGLQGLGPAAFAAGAAMMALETVWTRLLTLVLGASAYAFSLMLCAFLLGMGLGGLWAWRRPVLFRRLRTGAAFILSAAALASWLGVWVAPRLPLLYLAAFEMSGGGRLPLAAGSLALSLFALFPAAFFLGAFLPQCFWAVAAEEASGPASVGRLGALHGAGALAGAAGAAFIVIPAAGTRGCLLLCAALLWASAAAVLATGSRSPQGALKALATYLGAALLAARLSPAWKAGTLSGGIYLAAPKVLDTLRRPEAGELFARLEVFHKEGPLATVYVSDRLWLSPGPERAMAIDGKVDASTERDMPTQVLMAHLPLLLAGGRGDVFLAGLASGVTAGEALRHPISSLTVAEIEPAVAEASRSFEPFNNKPLDDPRTRLILEDARAALARSPKRYRVILSQPSNPWQAGSARLFTREYFRLAQSRLEPGGVFGLWLQAYSLAPEHLRLAARTLLAVFPHAALFETAPGDLVLLASDEPLDLDLGGISGRLAPVRAGLAAIGADDEFRLLARWRMGTAGLVKFSGAGRLNTDDNALLEFSAGRDLLQDTVEANRRALRAATEGPFAYLKEWTPEQAAELAEAQLGQGEAQLAELSARKALELRPLPEGAAALSKALRAQGKAAEARSVLAAALKRWQASPSLIFEASEEAWGAGDGARALKVLQALPSELRGRPYRRARAKALWSLGRCRRAREDFEASAEEADEAAAARLYAPGCGPAAEAGTRTELRGLLDRWSWRTPAEQEARMRRLLDGSALAGPDKARLAALSTEEIERPLARLKAALGLAALGRWKKAAEELSREKAGGAGFALLLDYYRGLCLAQAGEAAAARPLLSGFRARAAAEHGEDFRLVLAARELRRLAQLR